MVTFAITGRSWDMQGLFSVQEWIIFITRKNCQRCQNLRPTQNFIIFYSLKNGTFLHTLVLFHVFFSSFYIFFLFWEAMKYQWTRLSGTISILRFFKHYMCQTDKNSLAATISQVFDDVSDAVIFTESMKVAFIGIKSLKNSLLNTGNMINTTSFIMHLMKTTQYND